MCPGVNNGTLEKLDLDQLRRIKGSRKNKFTF
jgi:hypothetical protein